MALQVAAVNDLADLFGQGLNLEVPTVVHTALEINQARHVMMEHDDDLDHLITLAVQQRSYSHRPRTPATAELDARIAARMARLLEGQDDNRKVLLLGSGHNGTVQALVDEGVHASRIICVTNQPYDYKQMVINGSANPELEGMTVVFGEVGAMCELRPWGQDIEFVAAYLDTGSWPAGSANGMNVVAARVLHSRVLALNSVLILQPTVSNLWIELRAGALLDMSDAVMEAAVSADYDVTVFRPAINTSSAYLMVLGNPQ